jgi:predicted 2-oxoglutarate/Fe(II)-dependent dioxygenase YbiX
LDQTLRVLGVFPFENTPDFHVATVLRFLEGLPSLQSLEGFAPVLLVPNVFERAFCRSLIRLYEQHGGTESGYMKEMGGKTVQVLNRDNKRRSDHILADPQVLQAAEARLSRCLIPQIKNAFQFDASYIERYIVACYDAAVRGFFRKHRDDMTRGTAHQRFAVTINLNAEEYEGGDLSFPEFGPRCYRAPTGGAMVFSCRLMHQVTPVTKGKRYAFLPFLYDEEAAKIREANLSFLNTGMVYAQS